MKKILRLPILTLAFIFYSCSCYCQSQTLLDQKLNLEKSIQERAERIIEKIIGSRDMVVLVNVALEKEEKAAGNKNSGYMSMQNEEYLPGITYSYMPGEGGPASSNIVIKKIDISVTVSVEVSNEISNRIRTEVTNLLGLNTIRGDAVVLQKILFARNNVTWKEQLLSFGPHFYWLFGFMLITIFLFGPLRSFFKTIVKAMEIRIEADTRVHGMEEIRGGITGSGATLLPGAGGGALELNLGRRRSLGEGEKQGPLKKFSYINRDNLKNLIFLLKNEKAGTIAIISSYLPPDFTSDILGSLPLDKQSQVAVHLTTPKVIDPLEVNQVEAEYKQKIDYLVGGEEYFLNMLDQINRESQENILKTLERDNPTLATKLKQSLFFFEDILILDKNVLQRVVRELQKNGLSLALALKSAKEEIKQKVMDVLTEGARAMLSEQIDLIGEMSQKRIIDEQKAIVTIIRELEKSGDIIIDRSKKEKILESTDIATDIEEVKTKEPGQRYPAGS